MITKSTILDVRHLTRIRGVLGRLTGILALSSGLVLGLPAGPASDAPSLSVAPGSGLDPAGQFVIVNGSGYQPNAPLFVMQCRATSAEDHTCNSVGLAKVTTNAGGSFSTRLRVVGNFGATDCQRTACGVKTSAVSGHADDRSQDRNARISFAAPAPPVTQPPTTQPPVTAPPATAAPTPQLPATPAPTAGAGTPTTVPGTTTTTEGGSGTTAEPGTSTTTGPGTSTTTEPGDASGPDGGDEVAAAAGSPVSSARDDDQDGSSSAPAIIAGVVALAALGAGTTVFLRRRSAGA